MYSQIHSDPSMSNLAWLSAECVYGFAWGIAATAAAKYIHFCGCVVFASCIYIVLQSYYGVSSTIHICIRSYGGTFNRTYKNTKTHLNTACIFLYIAFEKVAPNFNHPQSTLLRTLTANILSIRKYPQYVHIYKINCLWYIHTYEQSNIDDEKEPKQNKIQQRRSAFCHIWTKKGPTCNFIYL